MRHVDHEIGADLVGDLAEAAEIDDARIGRTAGNDHFRPMLFGEPLDLFHVDEMIVAPHAIRDDFEPLAGQIDGRTVGQVSAGGEIEAHERIAWLHQRHEDFGIGGGAGMRLHICEIAAEQAGHTFDRETLGDIDELAAAVIALSRQAFGVFVGEHRALRLKHGAADDILRRDQFDLVALAAELEPDGLGDLGVAFGERGREEILGNCVGFMRDRHRSVSCLNSSLNSSGQPCGVIHRSPASYQPRAARPWDISADNAAIFRD